MSVGRVLALVLGVLIGLVGLGVLIGGGVLAWGLTTQRDDDGFFSTDPRRFETSTYALTSEGAEVLVEDAPGWLNADWGTVRVRASREGGGNVFVGIGRESDVDNYLANVAHDEVTDIEYDPFEVTYRRDEGTAAPAAPPTGQTFWAASASGPGQQELTWDLESGRWVLVVMNADASPGVLADVGLGGKSGLLGPITVVLLIVGVLLFALGTALVVLALVRRGPPAPAASAPGATTPRAAA